MENESRKGVMVPHSIQRWGFVLLFTVTYSFSIVVILSSMAMEPKVSFFKHQGPLPLVDVAGHHAILLSPYLKAMHDSIFDASLVGEQLPNRRPYDLPRGNARAFSTMTVDRGIKDTEKPPETISIPVVILLFLFLSIIVVSKTKKYLKKRRAQSLEAFARDLDGDDLVFDISYGNASKDMCYGSFVPTQPGDYEKFDI